MIQYSKLNKLEKLIISMLASSRERRTPYGLNALENNINERLYDRDEVTKTISNLKAKGIIEDSDTTTIINRDYYLYVWRLKRYNLKFFARKFSKQILKAWNFLWSHFVVTIITSVVVAYLVTNYIK